MPMPMAVRSLARFPALPMNEELGLCGGRKKPERRPRSEGLVRLAGRRAWYARLWLPGHGREVYRSTYSETVQGAEAAWEHVRAEARRQARKAAPVTHTQIDFPYEDSKNDTNNETETAHSGAC